MIARAEKVLDFLDSIVTGDGIWCLNYDPDVKRKPVKWMSKGEPKSKKLRFQKSGTKTNVDHVLRL